MSPKDKKQCPACHEWFHIRGIGNHIRVAHPKIFYHQTGGELHRDKSGMPLILKGKQATINEPTDPPCENELELAQERIKNLQLQLDRERIKVDVLEGLFNEVLDRIR